MLTHGWPWTFWDFRDVIERLVEPDEAGFCFDLVIPSLPGFGFSSPLRRAGVNFARTAELWDALMRDVLGYPRYAAHGGDCSSRVRRAWVW